MRFALALLAAAVGTIAACSSPTSPPSAGSPPDSGGSRAGSSSGAPGASSPGEDAGGGSGGATGSGAGSGADSAAPPAAPDAGPGSSGHADASTPDGASPGHVDASATDAGQSEADAGAGSGGVDAGLPKIPGTITIMPVGDSITRATCWRALLWQQLNAAFPSRFHLVGTLSSDPGCGVTGYDTANQGYSSSLVTEVVAGITNARTCDPFCPALSDLVTAFDAVKPDVMLMHYGTNDVWNSKAPADILNAYGAVIDAVRAANPTVVILLAQILPMNVTAATCSGCSCASCPTAVPALNAQIATWAPTKSTAASPIVVVDQFTGFDAVNDTKDGVHPNNTTGSQKMAGKWYAALAPLF